MGSTKGGKSMKQYTKMIVFVLILGLGTSLVFIGMDALTKDRIAANASLAAKSTVLLHNDIEFTTGNVNEVFDEFITIYEYEVEGQTLYLYENKENGNLSFEYGIFDLNGLWGPIKGFMTLQSDFETIVDVSVLEEEETPGLGGKVKDRLFLDTLIGKVMTPSIMIRKDAAPNLNNEVDEISGATGTSGAFERLLNDSYTRYVEVYQNVIGGAQ
jgi:Na+-transporting NADH:ubiquinone oxidoreductase subunit C